MRRFISALSVLSLIPVLVPALAGPSFAAPRLESMIPGETAVVLLVEEVSDFRAAWPQSPLGRVWNDPEVRKSGTPGDKKNPDPMDRVRAATGLDLVEILDGFEGQAAYCIPTLAAILSEEHPWAVVAVCEDEASWRRVMARVLEARSGEPTVAGRAKGGLTVLPASGELPALAEIWADGVGMLGSPPSYVQDLHAARAGGSAPLDAQPAFAELVALSPGGDAALFIDLRELADAFRNLVLGGAAEDSLTGAFLGLDPVAAVDAIGLEAFRALRITATLAEDETRSEAGILVDDRPGLSRLLAYLPGPCPRPELIPEAAAFASVSRFSFRSFWESLIGILEAFSPGMSSLLRVQLQTMTLSAGVDFERDFLGHLGDETWSVYLPGTGEPGKAAPRAGFDQITGITVDDPVTVGTALTALTASLAPLAAGGMDTRNVNGIEIHVAGLDSAGVGDGDHVAYALADSTLLVGTGSPDALDRLLTGARGGRASLWHRKDLAPLFGSIPPDACSIAYWDPSAMSRALQNLPDLGDDDEDADESPGPRDAVAQALASAIERHLGPALATTSKTPSGYVSRLHIRHPGR